MQEDGIIKKLEDFDPDELTTKLLEASKEFDIAENNVSVAETLADTKIRNYEDIKLSETKIASLIKKDKLVAQAKIELITKKADYDSARLKREDYLRKHDRDKKLADIQKIGY